ncbi:hypothetical protein [Acaryochloris marina]|uniref:Uncharacterized protein n=1 Tax=Acaryochloris marina (strain MBIC 11017) TaxID=329726 RepID=A8ZPG4_ACAM1|nr:hypothetical protein [Acaryochloris marina]ABW32900.1 hypothetical protein AM1_E0131 [Acaryochloris marina MBIC11017]
MNWIILLICVIVFIVYWSKRRQSRGNLGKVIDYSKGNQGVRREQWQNYSSSEAKLIQRIGHEATERLIVSVLLDNPTKSRAWCMDKALRDLERDQGL